MAIKPKTSPRVFPRQTIPLTLLRSDMANACVPVDYLNSLIKPRTKQVDATTDDLMENPHLSQFERMTAVIGKATNTQTFLVKDKHTFVSLATECLMCAVGSLAVVDPGQIANSYISATARGHSNELVNDYLATIDLLFIDAAVAPVVTGYIQSSPEAAHHVYSFFKTTKYMSAQHLVLDMSAYYRQPEKGRPSVSDATTQVYGYDTANLLLADAITL